MTDFSDGSKSPKSPAFNIQSGLGFTPIGDSRPGEEVDRVNNLKELFPWKRQTAKLMGRYKLRVHSRTVNWKGERRAGKMVSAKPLTGYPPGRPHRLSERKQRKTRIWLDCQL